MNTGHLPDEPKPPTKQLTIEQLRALREHDPDGKPTEPTDEDYKQFERYVISTYGYEALAQYFGHWDEGGQAHE